MTKKENKESKAAMVKKADWTFASANEMDYVNRENTYLWPEVKTNYYAYGGVLDELSFYSGIIGDSNNVSLGFCLG